jgi:hypothetical protein
METVRPKADRPDAYARSSERPNALGLRMTRFRRFTRNSCDIRLSSDEQRVYTEVCRQGEAGGGEGHLGLLSSSPPCTSSGQCRRPPAKAWCVWERPGGWQPDPPENLRLHDARGVPSAAEGEYGGREPSCHRDRDGDGAAAALALGVEQGDAQAAIAQPR